MISADLIHRRPELCKLRSVIAFAAPYRSGRLQAFDWCVIVAFTLMSLVVFSPDPGDCVLSGLLVCGILMGPLKIRRLEAGMTYGLALVGLLLVAILSALIATVDLNAIANLAVKMSLAFFLKMYIGSYPQARAVFFGYLGAFLVTAFVATGVVDTVAGGAGDFTGVVDLRFQGLMGDPNILGSFLAPLAIWVMDESLCPKVWRVNTVLKVFILLGVVAMIASTMSRGAWLNLVVGIAFYAAAVFRAQARIHTRSLVMILLMTGLALGFCYEVGYIQDLRARLDLKPSDFERVDYQSMGGQIALQRPFGIGPMQAPVLLGHSPHNSLVQVVLEDGWLSLLPLGILAVLAISHFGPCVSRGAEHIEFGISCRVVSASVIGFFANAMVIDVLYWRTSWMLVAFTWLMVSRRAPCRQQGAVRGSTRLNAY